MLQDLIPTQRNHAALLRKRWFFPFFILLVDAVSKVSSLSIMFHLLSRSFSPFISLHTGVFLYFFLFQYMFLHILWVRIQNFIDAQEKISFIACDANVTQQKLLLSLQYLTHCVLYILRERIFCAALKKWLNGLHCNLQESTTLNLHIFSSQFLWRRKFLQMKKTTSFSQVSDYWFVSFSTYNS